MTAEHEIGRVVAVDTAQVTVELNRDLKALTRSTYEGTVEVGRINSYIIIPVGARRIVAMVTRVVMTEESELKADKTMVALPSTRRLMKATMIGSIDGNDFRQGINVFPVLDSKVYLTTKKDLDSIFGYKTDNGTIDPEEPGYCIPVGRSAVFPDYDVRIDPDAFFGKHAAIIGSTGSGKSCSIATILQSILSTSEVKQSRIIILDTNGEYRAAFDSGKDAEKKKWDTLYIPTDSQEQGSLAIPYWFMDSEDFVRLFRAAPGVQRPVLLNALTAGRQGGLGPRWTFLRSSLIQECNRILTLLGGEAVWQTRATITEICNGVISTLGLPAQAQSVQELTAQYPALLTKGAVDVFREVLELVQRSSNQDYAPIVLDRKMGATVLIEGLTTVLASVPSSDQWSNNGSADKPSYFSRTAFRVNHMENAMSRDNSSSARTRENCATMVARVDRLLQDTRFEFLFGPKASEWPMANGSLAAFIRDILGLQASDPNTLSSEAEVPVGVLGFYDRQRNQAKASNVVILDLSLLASEVLENVTALIGRLIHEFLQRLSDPSSGIKRGEFPVVLVLEEAQNYIREGRGFDEESISKQVFERIAREGRKFGLGLVIASQRPSELSKTVLSQCNSFVVHRLQNPEDLRYFKEIVPGIYGQLLDQLPALAPQSALVLGECVQAPVLVHMRDADPTPQSKNPQFFKSWTGAMKVPDVEAVCAKWEGVPSEVPTAQEEEGTVED